MTKLFDSFDPTEGKRFLDCPSCVNPNPNHFNYQMCKHILEEIDNNEDPRLDESTFYAVRACHKARVQVGSVPWLGWTTVLTGVRIGEFLPIRLTHTRNNGQKVTADLGLISPNEGRLVVSRSIMDFILSQCHYEERWRGGLKTRCPSRYHRHPEQAKIASIDMMDFNMKSTMLTSIVLEGACIFCLLNSHVDDDYGLGGESFAVHDHKTTQLLDEIRRDNA